MSPEMVRCDAEYCCGQLNEWPDLSPCPKCGSIDNVMVWEAWGHPSGELFCTDCTRFYSGEEIEDYWTWHMENGQPVIDKWERQEPVVGDGGLIAQGWISNTA